MLNQKIREKLIVVADDFGISEEANRRILELLAGKKIDRVAVMIDGLRLPTEEEKRQLLGSGAALDIHLNGFQRIEAGRKLQEPVIPRAVSFVRRLIAGEIRQSRMEKSWDSEIARFGLIFGRFPDGISAHQHIHFFPAYFRSVIRLAQKFGIPYIRFGRKGMAGKSQSSVYRVLSQLQKSCQRFFDRSGLQSSDYWFSLDWISDRKGFLEALPEGKTELVVHPERPEEYAMVKKEI